MEKIGNKKCDKMNENLLLQSATARNKHSSLFMKRKMFKINIQKELIKRKRNTFNAT